MCSAKQHRKKPFIYSLCQILVPLMKTVAVSVCMLQVYGVPNTNRFFIRTLTTTLLLGHMTVIWLLQEKLNEDRMVESLFLSRVSRDSPRCLRYATLQILFMILLVREKDFLRYHRRRTRIFDIWTDVSLNDNIFHRLSEASGQQSQDKGRSSVEINADSSSK